MVESVASEANQKKSSGGESSQMSGSLDPSSGGPFAVSSVSFNARGDHFVVGTSNGFMIYETEPFKLVNSTDIIGGVKTVQLLNQGKKLFVALVGSGLNMSYPTHKIVFWEADQD